MRNHTVLMSTLALALLGCKEPPASDAKSDGQAATTGAEAAGKDSSSPTTEAPPPTANIDRLLAWMPAEPLAVAYDRLSKPFDPAPLATVFGIPPKAADLLDERETLDQAFELVFEGEDAASSWLERPSFAFTVAISKSPYFVRPLSKSAAEVSAVLERSGFTKNTIDGVELWLPSGSFPWRIALLGPEGQAADVAAFIPVDVPGAGLEALTSDAEPGAGASSVDAEIRRTLGDDPMIELVLVSSGPLVHFDVKQTIAQVQFALRGNAQDGSYEGQIVLVPSHDPNQCASDLRERAYPEENQQIQALVKAVEFVVDQGAVIGRLALDRDGVDQLLRR